MKLIKLDGRHNLYQKGYRYAFLFEHGRWGNEVRNIENIVGKLEGCRWDNTFWGKEKHKARPYYVGVKNESTATMVMLQV